MLRLVLRSYGGDNRKDRPEYYSKDLALASFVRAAQAVDAEVVFVNDGPIPAHRLAVMERTGRVVAIPDGPVGMRRSYVFALDLPDTLGWDDADVVSYNEDDYLFAADAFAGLAEAAAQLPEASYFALSGIRPDDTRDPAQIRLHQVPKGWQPQPDLVAGGRTWINVLSTTSTFAGRVGALRADRDIFEQCMRPFRNRFLDHETCLLYQGIRPYHGAELFFGLGDDFVPSVRGVARATVLLPYRVLINRRSRRQPTPHLLYAPAPSLATHLELGVMVAGERPWEDIAADVQAWARTSGLGFEPETGPSSDTR